MQHLDRERKLRTSQPFSSLLTSIQKYNCGATYRGQSCQGKRCGVGVFSWPNGETYVGQFDKNRRNGKGYCQRSL